MWCMMIRDLFKSGIKKDEAVQNYQQYLFLNIRTLNVLLYRWLEASKCDIKVEIYEEGGKKVLYFRFPTKISICWIEICIAISHHSIYTQT